jgi:bla regulator protein BlaR1
MIAEIFAYSTLVALLIGLAAIGVERLLGELRLPRRLAWLGAFVSALLLPTLSLLWRAETLPAAASGPAGSPLITPESSIDWNTTLILLWAVATAILLVCYLAAWLRLTLLARRWLCIESDAGSVVVTDDVGPAVLGVVWSRVVLPRWLMTAPANLRKTVMMHELAHVAARDPLLLTAAHLVTILLPWNLPLWWFARRLRIAIELDCDARVLRAGVDASDYGEVLLAVAQRHTAIPGLAASMTEPATQLERRIRIMLARDQPASMQRSAAAALLALGIAACATTVEPPAMPRSATPSADADGEFRLSGSVEKIVSGGDSGTAHKLVRNSDGTVTLHSPELVLHLTSGAQMRATTDQLTKSTTRVVLEGGVKFELEGTSLTATRAVVTETPDGRITLTAENAVVVHRP